MLVNPSKIFLAIAMTGVFFSMPVRMQAQGQAAETRQWKDRAEYDLYQAITTGKDPAGNLTKLDEWKKSYPETQFLKERRALYLNNYVGAGKIQDAVTQAKEILGTDANDFTSLYYITLYTPALVPAGSTTVPPDILDQGEKAAQGMLTNLDKQKPANMADAQWETAKKPIAAVAHTTLGWVAMQRKDNEKAEGEFKQSLGLNPANGDVAYWLGIVDAAQKKVEKMPETLFYFARAGNYTGQGAASPGIRQAANQYLDKAYVNYHGDKEGLDQLKQTAANTPMAPADFKIVSVVDKEKAKIEQENKMRAEHPELALFQSIKDALTGAEGATYFRDKMKDAELPTLKAKVIKLEPETNPKTIVVGILDPNTPDATLHMDAALPGKVEPGAEISFEGVPESYTASPFMVNFKVEKAKLHGWTGKGAARPAPARRPVRRK